MDLHALRVFKAVVDHRGFSRGGEAVLLTQSAASQAVRRLEDDLETKLLVRGRPPVLTAAGRRVYQHATEVLERENLVRREIEEIEKGGEGLLTLGASQALSREVLPDLMTRFHQLYPETGLHLETLPSREIIRVVMDGRLDLGLGPFARSMAGLTVHELGRQRMVLYAGRRARGLKALRGEGKPGLKRMRLVTSYVEPAGSGPRRGLLREHFRSVWEVHSLDLRLELVRRGLAVGYLPEATVKASKVARELTALRWLDLGVIERRMGLFHRSRVPLAPAAARLLELARAAPVR